MQANEQWKAIPGLEGRYEVSSLGRVKSLLRGERILLLCQRKTGYLTVIVGGKSRRVHRLVLEAFVGPCPDRMQACHWNDIPDDNRIENLRWDTRDANFADQRRNASNKPRRSRQTHGGFGRGAAHIHSKLTEAQALAILNEDRRSNRVLAKELGVSPSTVAQIRTGRKWACLRTTA